MFLCTSVWISIHCLAARIFETQAKVVELLFLLSVRRGRDSTLEKSEECFGAVFRQLQANDGPGWLSERHHLPTEYGRRYRGSLRDLSKVL